MVDLDELIPGRAHTINYVNETDWGPDGVYEAYDNVHVLYKENGVDCKIFICTGRMGIPH